MTLRRQHLALETDSSVQVLVETDDQPSLDVMIMHLPFVPLTIQPFDVLELAQVLETEHMHRHLV